MKKHYTLYNIVKAGSILSDTFRLSYFHPVVETGRAPSHYRLMCILSYHLEGMRRGTPRLYNWVYIRGIIK